MAVNAPPALPYTRTPRHATPVEQTPVGVATDCLTYVCRRNTGVPGAAMYCAGRRRAIVARRGYAVPLPVADVPYGGQGVVTRRICGGIPYQA